MSLLTTIRRWMLAAPVLACAALAVPAGAFAADPPLRLRIGGNSLVLPVSLITASPDVEAARAVTLRPPGGGGGSAQRGGTSVAHLLELLGISPDAIERVEIQAGDGPTTMLSTAEARDGFIGDPACSACQATFDLAPTDGVVRFLRPLREPGGSTDDLEPRRGQSLFVRLVPARSGPQAFGVNVTPSTVTPRAGQRVRFSSTPVGAPADTTYTWYFGDATTAQGPTASHRFEAGNWPSGVLATSGGRFAAGAVVIRAQAPRDDPSPAPRRAPERTASPAATASPGPGTPSAGAAASPGPTGTRGGGTAAAPATTTATVATPVPTATPVPVPANPRLIPVSGVLIRSPGRAVTIGGASSSSDPQRGRAPAPADAPSDGSAVRSASSGILLFGVLAAGALTERRRAQRSLRP